MLSVFKFFGKKMENKWKTNEQQFLLMIGSKANYGMYNAIQQAVITCNQLSHCTNTSNHSLPPAETLLR